MRNTLNRSYYANKKAPVGCDVQVIEVAEPVISNEDFLAYLRETAQLETEGPSILTDMVRIAMQTAKSKMNASAGVERLRVRWQRVHNIARIPYGPVGEIHSVQRETGDGQLIELQQGRDYVISGNQIKEIELLSRTITLGNSYRGDDSIIIEYDSGYDANHPLMPNIRGAVRILAADQYMMRTSVVDGSGMPSVQRAYELLKPCRLV